MLFALVLLLGTVPSAAAASPPGGASAVPLNTQTSLVKIVGEGFGDQSWQYPKGLFPAKFEGQARVSGPEDVDLSPKAAWRKPVVLKHAEAGAEVRINCYRRLEPRSESPLKTPVAPLTEPDAEFVTAGFHDLKAASASTEGRAVFAFVDGDFLFKAVATGGKKQDELPAIAKATAEAIWSHRHPK